MCTEQQQTHITVVSGVQAEAFRMHVRRASASVYQPRCLFTSTWFFALFWVYPLMSYSWVAPCLEPSLKTFWAVLFWYSLLNFFTIGTRLSVCIRVCIANP
jgi:hypothetical protein